jgi:hypothetical protein
LIYNSYLKFLQKRNWFQQKQERQIILKVNINFSFCIRVNSQEWRQNFSFRIITYFLIFLKAYEHLIKLTFILPATDSSSSRNSKVSKEHSLMYLALDKEEIEKCIAQYPNCPTELSLHSKIF